MTEEKEKQEELNPIEIIVQNDTSNVKEKTEIGIPLLDLSINDLILKMVEFSNKENCLTVSKNAEEVRSIFYQKLKDLKKENEVEKEENQKTEKIILHPHEIEFKRAYKKFKSIKNKHRKEKDEMLWIWLTFSNENATLEFPRKFKTNHEFGRNT